MGNQGFASMDKERLKELSRKGGKTASERGTRHSWTTEQAKEMSKKGHEQKRLKKLEKKSLEDEPLDS